MQPTPRTVTPCLLKLEALPWSHFFTSISHGVSLHLRSNDEQLLDSVLTRVQAQRAPGQLAVVDEVLSIAAPSPRKLLMGGHYAAYVGGHVVARSKSREEIVHAAASSFHQAVAQHCQCFTFVHAGCVVIDGAAVVIPGLSRSGKSTLVAALLDLGASYMSDEYALLDSAGRVYPYLKPLGLRAEDGLTKNSKMPLCIASERAYRVACVVSSAFDPAAPGFQPRASSKGEIALALLSNTIRARLSPAACLSAASAVARQAHGLLGKRGHASDAAQHILTFVRNSKRGSHGAHVASRARHSTQEAR